MIGPFIVVGVGMALFFAPAANLVPSAVERISLGEADQLTDLRFRVVK